MKVILALCLIGVLRLSGCAKYTEEEPGNVLEGTTDGEDVPSEDVTLIPSSDPVNDSSGDPTSDSSPDPIQTLLDVLVGGNAQAIDSENTADGVVREDFTVVGSPPEQNLDLTKPHSSVKVTDSDEDNGVKRKEYTLGLRKHMLSVLEDGKEIWKAGDGEKCYHVETYSKDESVLLTLMVDGKDNRLREKYFEKNGSIWNEITDQVHKAKLDAMKGVSTQTSSG